jgi:NADH-quinone oxidoreductase subunit L
VLLLVGFGLPRPAVAMLGCGSVAVSAVLSLLIWGSFAGSPPAGHAFQQTLWTWMDVGGLRPAIGFYLDALSLVMILVVTCVGFLIHVYSSEFMIEDDAYSRFFAYMNLFVA